MTNLDNRGLPTRESLQTLGRDQEIINALERIGVKLDPVLNGIRDLRMRIENLEGGYSGTLAGPPYQFHTGAKKREPTGEQLLDYDQNKWRRRLPYNR